MEIINTTSLPTQIFLQELDGSQRACRVVAKATYKYDERGHITPERDAPCPVLCDDLPTALGLIPRDDLPPPSRFQVFVHAVAHAPQATKSMTVALELGDHRRELAIFGDRTWQKDQPGAATNFTQMPIVYQYAFGGSVDVLFDKDSPLKVAWPLNGVGRGFDPEPFAQGLAHQYACASGYPQYSRERMLPNIEAVDELVQGPEDTPSPAGWAPLPPEVPLHAYAHLQEIDGNGATGLADVEPNEMPEYALLRAHPSLLFDKPVCGQRMRLEGVDPAGTIVFTLPTPKVEVDVALGNQRLQLELQPTSLLVLAEDRQLIVSLNADFEFELITNEERSLRVRSL